MSKYIHQLTYVRREDSRERLHFIFSSKKAAMDFYNECSEDNDAFQTIYYDKMQRGVSGVFFEIGFKMLHEQ